MRILAPAPHLSIDGASVTYDALGRMVEQNTSGSYTQIVYAPSGAKLALMNGTTVQKAFVPLPGGSVAVYNSSGLAYYRHSDWLGSSRFASTPSRAMYYDGAYGPFGEPYAQSGTADVSFTGMNQDTVANLYDFPAREYGIQGRWPSPDPAGILAIRLRDPQTLNRCAYVRNSPLEAFDPTGLFLVELMLDDGTSFWADTEELFGAGFNIQYDSNGNPTSITAPTDANTTFVDSNGNTVGALAAGSNVNFGIADWQQEVTVSSSESSSVDSASFAPPSMIVNYVSGGGLSPTAQRYLRAIAQGTQMAAKVIPTVFGGGVFAFAGPEGEKGAGGVLAEYDTGDGLTVNFFGEVSNPTTGSGGGAFTNTQNGVNPFVFVPTGGAGGVVAFKGGVGLYAGEAAGSLGYGAGVYVNITSVAGCKDN